MARFRSLKSDLRTRLESSDWRRELDAIAALSGKETVGPLMSFLLLGGAMKWRAAVALGLCVAGLAEAHREDARVVVRRLMWHMNEESGNIGWGIPEAMAEILASHRGLAEEYHRILISYVRDTDKDNNFCDHAPLRRSCYWAVGRLAQAWPDLARGAGEPLLAGLHDEDAPCRGAAAWALGQLMQAVDKNATSHLNTPESLTQTIPYAAIPPETRASASVAPESCSLAHVEEPTSGRNVAMQPPDCIFNILL